MYMINMKEHNELENIKDFIQFGDWRLSQMIPRDGITSGPPSVEIRPDSTVE